MSFEDNVGPLCTEEQAIELLDELLDAKPSSAKIRDFEPYIRRMVRLPYAYLREAIEELSDGPFMPGAGEIDAKVMEIWPPKDFTGGDEVRNGRSQAVAGR